VGGGNYAKFWKYKSPVFVGGLVVFGVVGGLTGSCAGGGPARTARGFARLSAGRGGRGRGRQVGRSACGCAPAFGRAVGPLARLAYGTAEAVPLRWSWWVGRPRGSRCLRVHVLSLRVSWILRPEALVIVVIRLGAVVHAVVSISEIVSSKLPENVRRQIYVFAYGISPI